LCAFLATAKIAAAQNSDILFPEISEPFGKLRPPFWETYWPYIAVFCAIMAIAALFIFRRKKSPPLSAYELAMLTLSNAKNMDASESDKKYAMRVSDAVRQYIEALYNIPAPERTTQEFLQIASADGAFAPEEQETLKRILDLADMSKFAAHSFLAAEREEILRLAEAFIEADNNRRAKSDSDK